MSGRRALLAAALLIGAPPVAMAQVAAPAAVLRQGTPVALKTLTPLSSRRARQGQRFDLEVSDEVRVDGLLVIPRGAHGVGEVSRVVTKGMMGKPGKIEVRALYVEVGGARIRLDGVASDKGASGAAPVVLAAPLIGVSAAFFRGKSAMLPAGSTIEGFVYQDMPLVRPAAGE